MTSNDDSTRRTVLKGLAGLGAAGVVGGLGIGTFASSAAAAGASISANGPATISNDRGDISEVTIDPKFRVEWRNMDEAVGKVFVLVEAKVPNQGDFTPLFRMTPWLTPDTNALGGVRCSKPGTTGHYELNLPLSRVLRNSVEARGNLNSAPRALPRPIVVANEAGRPDYEGADYSSMGGVDAASYLGGSSLGGADQAEQELVDGQGLPLVNNFPGAASGYYGAATDTTPLDQPVDGENKSTTIRLRYTFALYTVNSGMQGYLPDSLGSGWQEHLRSSDIQEDGQGNSVLVMNAEDGYPDIGNNGAGSPAEKNYSALHAIADNHPAVMKSSPAFAVSVENQAASSSGSGSSNTGASGGGQ